ncbi:bifunctional DNA primase/polymerase [bacterium]|nr:bifunctional DNA primase/polymerase [bacterium]
MSLGWSVIPLFGDANPARGKAPALSSWKAYQSRLATRQELLLWSQSGEAQALGIVLGAVSGMAVLDIDDAATDAAFRRCCPDLAETLVVVSGNRGQPHYYYRLPVMARAGVRHVTSWHIPGADFKAEGGYVVAPGTVIDGRCWQVRDDVAPRKLSEADLSRLEAFARFVTRKQPSNRADGPSGANDGQSSTATNSSEHPGPGLTAGGLRRRYHNRAAVVGRNNALFEMSCHARDHGWSESAVAAALVGEHSNRPAPPGHRRESLRRREAEAAPAIARRLRVPRRVPCA